MFSNTRKDSTNMIKRTKIKLFTQKQGQKFIASLAVSNNELVRTVITIKLHSETLEENKYEE